MTASPNWCGATRTSARKPNPSTNRSWPRCRRTAPSATRPPSSAPATAFTPIAGERAKLQKTLAAEFPDYSALSNPLPLNAKEVQSLLSADEAMVLFAVAEKESYVFVLTRDGADWKPIPIGADALSGKIAAFRCG